MSQALSIAERKAILERAIDGYRDQRGRVTERRETSAVVVLPGQSRGIVAFAKAFVTMLFVGGVSPTLATGSFAVLLTVDEDGEVKREILDRRP